MDAYDLLLTIAEIAIALAGFSGVVAVFGGKVVGIPNFRLSLLLSLSGEAVVFGLLPSLLSLRLAESTTWLLAALLYGVVHLAHIAHSIFGYKDEKQLLETPKLDKVLMSIGAMLSIALVIAAFSESLPDIQLLYVSLLIFVLGVAGTQFFRLLVFVQDTRGDGGES